MFAGFNVTIDKSEIFTADGIKYDKILNKNTKIIHSAIDSEGHWGQAPGIKYKQKAKNFYDIDDIGARPHKVQCFRDGKSCKGYYR